MSTRLLILLLTVHSPELLNSPAPSSIHMKSLETKQFFFCPAQFHLICEIILLSFIVYSALVTLRSD